MKEFSILDFGAGISDRVQTKAIQSAIDACFLAGGGHVTVPAGVFLTGGMRNFDPVTFSSIGDDTAMLCLQQEIFWKGKSVVPFEKKVPFDRDFSLYKNLAASFAFCLAEALFLEDL